MNNPKSKKKGAQTRHSPSADALMWLYGVGHFNELVILFIKYWIVSNRSKRSSFQARWRESEAELTNRWATESPKSGTEGIT